MDENEPAGEVSTDDTAQKSLAESKKTNMLLGLIGGSIGLIVMFAALGNLSH